MEDKKHDELMDHCEKWTQIYNDLLSLRTMEEFHPFFEDELKSVKVFDLWLDKTPLIPYIDGVLKRVWRNR